MPRPIERLSLKEIQQMFPYDKLFTFREIRDGIIIYESDLYKIEFHINEFSNLEQSCTISDLTAAIDESKYFSVGVNL